MAEQNKVEYGICNVHYGTYDIGEDGTCILSKPKHIPGAISFEATEKTNTTVKYADNTTYYSGSTSEPAEGTLTMVLFPESFKTEILGYVKQSDGGFARLKGIEAKPFYLIFEGDGDKAKKRHIYYNVTAGAIKRTHKTVEGGKTVEEESLPITVTGDNKTKVVKVSYAQSDEVYDTIFNTAPVPTGV